MRVRRKKSLLTAFFFSILSWGVVGFFVFIVDPIVVRDLLLPGSYFPFFLFLFISVFLTGVLVLKNTRRGLIIAFGLVSFLFLRLIGLGHILNAILLFSFLFVLEMASNSQ